MPNHLGPWKAQMCSTTRWGISLPIWWYQWSNGNQLCSTETYLLWHYPFNVTYGSHLQQWCHSCLWLHDPIPMYDASAQAGVGKKPIEMKLKVLQWMLCYVKTAYGLSSTSFWNKFPCLVLGMLQGSSEVCPIWSLSSSVQFKVMDDQYPMAVFPSPHPEVYTKCNGESLIDDITLWETSAKASLPEVSQTMNSKAQAWEHGVHVSRGALNLPKTIYFAVSWKFWKNGQPAMQTVSDNPDIEIYLMQGNAQNHTTPITQVEATTRKHTLGVHLAPIGSDKTEYEFCLMEATKLRPCLLWAPLNWESTWKGFTTMILQKFSSPLGATCFTEKECNNIQANFLPTVLSKMGINKSMPMECAQDHFFMLAWPCQNCDLFKDLARKSYC